MQCAVSTASVLAFAYALVAVCFEFDYSAIFVRHVVPLLIMNYWLVMVTYLQHHEEDTKVRFGGGSRCLGKTSSAYVNKRVDRCTSNRGGMGGDGSSSDKGAPGYSSVFVMNITRQGASFSALCLLPMSSRVCCRCCISCV